MASRHTKTLLWTLLAVAVVLAIATVVLLTVPPPVERWLQGRMLTALREHYQSEIQLQDLHVTLIPEFQATAENFVLPNRSDTSLPPLITVRHISMEAGLFELLRKPVRITHVKLEGMEIKVGPRRGPKSEARPQPRSHTRLADFVIDRVEADGTKLYVLRKDPRDEPMLWELGKLELRTAGAGQPMKFTAELTNPTPPGVIDTAGHFGPWNFDEPSATAVDGHYEFRHADLSVFNGISGILSSDGDYSGMLQNITVDGTTDTPDFQLDRGGQPVHLTTKFHAIVDGTNGNTYLQPVSAHFLDSDLVTSGEVAKKIGEKGKTIALDVDIQRAHVQDVLELAAKADPPLLTGALEMKARVVLPPGEAAALQRMTVGGKFRVFEARFANEKMKVAVAGLSRRGQGKPDDETITAVPATFVGDFRLQSSALRFKSLQFVVPGAAAQVKGTYALRGGALDFTGDVRLHANISQTVTGAKHVLLVPFDPLFSKHGAGTYLPVSIDGTREHPNVHLEWKKLF